MVAGVEVRYIILLMLDVINNSVYRQNVMFFSEFEHIRFAHTPNSADVAVREAHVLGF